MDNNEQVGSCCWLEKLTWLEENPPKDFPDFLLQKDLFQGSIYLHKYNLAIGNTLLGNMNVFSYGKSKDCPNPIMHAVVDDPDMIGIMLKTII